MLHHLGWFSGFSFRVVLNKNKTLSFKQFINKLQPAYKNGWISLTKSISPENQMKKNI